MTTSRSSASAEHAAPQEIEKNPLRLLRGFSPELKNLLVSDVLIRFCEQIPYAYVVLWCMKDIAGARISATQFGFLLSGAAGQTYTVLVTTNVALPLANWSTVLTTNLSGSSATILDNQATNQRRFYRVKVGP